MIKNFRWHTLIPATVLLLAVVGLSACGTLNGFSNNPLAMVFVSKDTKYYSSHLTDTEVGNLRDVALRCGVQIGQQISSAGEALLSGAVQYGTGNGVGGLAANAFPGAVVGEYMLYGLGVGITEGAASGIGTWSYAKVSAIGGCMEAMIRGRELHHPELGLHIFVETAFVRSKLPSLLKAGGKARTANSKQKGLFPQSL